MAHMQQKVPANPEEPELQAREVVRGHPDDPALGGYTAKEILRAPLESPQPKVPQQERRATSFFGGIEVYRRIVILIGIGCFAISVLALLFLEAPFALVLMVVGILLVIGALVGKMVQARSEEEE